MLKNTFAVSKRPIIFGLILLITIVGFGLTTRNANAQSFQSYQDGSVNYTYPWVGPYANAPECPHWAHDDTKWHGLWNYKYGCHYTHEHKHDPNVVNYIFGGPRTNFNEPWNTPQENQRKHNGFGWLVLQDENAINKNNSFAANGQYEVECKPYNNDLSGETGCITAARVRVHALGSAVGAATRFHSYYAELKICNLKNECGLLRTGGWGDTGALFVPYPTGPRIPVANETHGDELQGTRPNGRHPYRAHAPSGPYQPGNIPNHFIWLFRESFGYNQIFMFGLESYDTWGGVDVNNTSKVELKCPDSQCELNGSTLKINLMTVHIPRELRQESGVINYWGFTDRQGNIDESCVVKTANCVPFVIENMPAGIEAAQYNIRSFISRGVIGELTEYDTSPEGVFWIQYPN